LKEEQMTVTHVFNHGRVIWDDGGADGVPEQALVIHIDSNGAICIDQEAQSVVMQPRTAEVLCKTLRELSRLAKKK
jgi:hypothetical protein